MEESYCKLKQQQKLRVMRKTFIYTLAYAFIVFFFFSCIHLSPIGGGVIEINDIRETGKPQIDSSIHKNHDVEVNRTLTWTAGEAYEIVFYREENDSLSSFRVNYGAEEEFDKAAYKWKNDSMVIVRLLSPVSNKKVKLKLWGYGNGSTTGVEECE
jgi:hypothetical protein